MRVGYLAQEESPGEDGLTGEETAVDLLVRSRAISAAEAGNFLHQFLFDHEQVVTPVRRMSYGERRRLALARFVLEGANLLLLGEPTNHLDLPSREAFEGALSSYAGGALIVTHDRYFIEQFADRVLEVVDGRVRLVGVRSAQAGPGVGPQ